MKVTDMLDSVGVGEDGVSLMYPDTFITDLRGAYDEDMAIPSAKIQVLETDLAAANEKILQLQAHNYELIQQIPSVDPGATDDTSSDDSANDDSDDEPQGIESLFESNKEDN